VFIPLIQQMGASDSVVYCVATMLIMLCSVACLTPSSTVGTPMIMGPEASMKEMFRYSLPFVIGVMILIALIYGLVIPAVI
jgi:di/tricarboxylate transporter